MKKPIEEQLDDIISHTSQTFTVPEEKVEDMAQKMIQYINAGAPYGMNARSGFLKWLEEQKK